MLDHATAHAADDRPLSDQQRFDRFISDIITLNAEGGATFGRLYELGWSPGFIEANLDKARAAANQRFLRDIRQDRSKPIDETMRDMADVIGSLLPPTQLLTAELQARGFSSRHIDLLLPKARATAALAFCHGQTGWAQ